LVTLVELQAEALLYTMADTLSEAEAETLGEKVLDV